MKNNHLMIKLDPQFQKELFTRIIKKYNGSINASRILKIPASSIRGYKNLYFNSIQEYILKKFKKIKITNELEISEKTISIFNKEELIKSSLSFGRQKRIENLKELKKKIPPLKAIIKLNYLDLDKWFKEYKNITNAGFRKIHINEKDSYFIIRYSNFTNKGYKNFSIKLPKRIFLNKEFSYFFGLWCGDRTGGKRFGIANKNKQIIDFTSKFLKKNYQKVEKILIIKQGLPEPRISYNKKYIINKSGKGWVLSTHSNNGILASFFYFLQNNLEEFLNSGYCSKDAFFAGLFDAEGNVSLYNKSFRWACMNKGLVNIYSKFLKEIGLFNKYDGHCIISYDIKKFYNKIFPCLKHLDKINKTKFLFNGGGSLPKEFKDVLNCINVNPKKTAKELSKTLKKTKVYSELKLLNDFGFILNKGYPYRFEITSKGLKSLGD